MIEIIKKFFKTDFGNGILAIIRNGAIIAIGFIVTGLITLVSGAQISEVYKLIIIGLLKMIDEYLHKTGLVEKGITRF